MGACTTKTANNTQNQSSDKVYQIIYSDQK